MKALRIKFKRAFTENIPLKTLSLFIAIILWMVVSGERNEEWSYIVPLDIVNQTEGLVISNDVPGFVVIRLRGSHSLIKGLDPKDMAVRIDVSNVTPGSHIYPITPDLVNAPSRAEVISINPSYLTLKFENIARKNVPLKADLQGLPRQDFFVESIDIKPAIIGISGPESEIKAIRNLKTASIDISGISKNITKTVAINVGDRKIQADQKDPVEVRINVSEILKKIEIKDIKPQLINLDKRYKATLSPKLMHILIEGPKSIVTSLQKTGVDITMDAIDLRTGSYKKSVKVNLPDQVKLLYSYPKELKLKVSRR